MTPFFPSPKNLFRHGAKIMALAALFSFGIIRAAHAQEGALEGELCAIVSMLNGMTGKAIATVAAMVLGIMALRGTLEWKVALVPIAGIALMMGAPTIIGALGGDGTCTPLTPSSTLNVIDCSNNMEQYGLTTGLVFCFRQDVDNATYSYIQLLTAALSNYGWVLFTFALSLFGVKLISGGVQNMRKEAVVLLFKFAISMFLILNAWNLYNVATGTMGEMINWVSSGFQAFFSQDSVTDTYDPATGENTVTFANGCVPVALPVITDTGAPVNSNEYIVWQAIDCMLKTMLGAVTTPGAVNTSMAMIIGLSFFSSTLGVMGAALGVSAFVAVMKMLLKGLYTVLIAYLSIGFLMILTPLFAPIIIFNYDYTRQVFEKWTKYIISTILQPVFIIAYLSFAIMIIDQFIDGGTNLSAATCTANTPTATPTVVGDPATVAGTASPCSCSIGSSPATGTGVCSFRQLFDMTNLKNIEEMNAKSNSWKVPADMFEAMSNNNNAPNNGNMTTLNGVSVNTTNNATFRENMLTAIKTNVIPRMHQFISFAGDLSFDFNRLSEARMQNGTMLQFMLMLVAFIITVMVLSQLMDVIPAMAQRMTETVGYDMAGAFDNAIKNSPLGAGLEGATTAMYDAAQGKGLLSGNLQGITGMGSVLRAGGSGMMQGIRNSLS